MTKPRETITVHHITPERTLLVMDYTNWTPEPEHWTDLRDRNQSDERKANERQVNHNKTNK